MGKKTDATLVLKKIAISWRKALTNILPFGGYSYYNQVHVVHDGDQAFAQIFAALLSAQTSIYIETFILAPDAIGMRLRDTLLEARQRNVEVTILYDDLGSASLTNNFLSPMSKAGIKVMAFNPIWPWRRRGPLLFRNHRKIIVVDEKIAFCGSMNLSVDYAGPIYGNNRFRDTLARIEGPAVADILKITKESIAESEFDNRPQSLSEDLPATDFTAVMRSLMQRVNNNFISQQADDRGTFVQVLRSNQRRNLSHIQHSMEEVINRSQYHCSLTTPYFLPHDKLRKALINAAQRGVDVRILTAGISDVPLMRLASHHVYSSFLDAGIRIFEMTRQTLHAKIATIDDMFSSIGSYNLDQWSARRNLEVNLSIIDHEIAVSLKEQFEIDLGACNEIDGVRFASRSFFRRVLCWFAYLLFRIK